jgi:hypothetical protein
MLVRVIARVKQFPLPLPLRMLTPSPRNLRILGIQLDPDEIPPFERTRYASGSGTAEWV